ncbi:hypothetical protein Bhyg_07602 [Pseudolycoriella hygida]|uniref:Uncharacterized protein n=1 Tax=Pseudolycoriella hygida TaxID=35572 RepID=A0A9Q0N302_9DIPT|nr:hypothetical protein Bhyg_07602 [Pseudolycoriella hygida]
MDISARTNTSISCEFAPRYPPEIPMTSSMLSYQKLSSHDDVAPLPEEDVVDQDIENRDPTTYSMLSPQKSSPEDDVAPLPKKDEVKENPSQSFGTNVKTKTKNATAKENKCKAKMYNLKSDEILLSDGTITTTGIRHPCVWIPRPKFNRRTMDVVLKNLETSGNGIHSRLTMSNDEYRNSKSKYAIESFVTIQSSVSDEKIKNSNYPNGNGQSISAHEKEQFLSETYLNDDNDHFFMEVDESTTDGVNVAKEKSYDNPIIASFACDEDDDIFLSIET